MENSQLQRLCLFYTCAYNHDFITQDAPVTFVSSVCQRSPERPDET